jgi:CPA2 family monovalent cation:H+ antiporter-2
MLPASGRTMMVVGAGLSQIGEFSFIVGQMGVALGALTQDQYSLILASSLLSIIINPLMFKLIPVVERGLQSVPALWHLLERRTETPEPLEHGMSDHVVVIGYGRVGEYIVNVLASLGVPRLVIEQDKALASEFQKRGVPTLFGDAANSELLTHAHLDRARALVVTISDETAAELIVTAAHAMAPNLPIIARAATREGMNHLSKHGARDVIHPELEGGLEVMRHTLLALDYPMSQVQQYVDAVRRDAYDMEFTNRDKLSMLYQLLTAVRGVQLTWITVGPNSPLVGTSLAEADLRAKTGASVIAIMRDNHVTPNPKSSTVFAEGDLIGLIGEHDQVTATERLINPPADVNVVAAPAV